MEATSTFSLNKILNWNHKPGLFRKLRDYSMENQLTDVSDSIMEPKGIQSIMKSTLNRHMSSS